MIENVLPIDGAEAWARVARRVEGQSWPTGALFVVATPIGNLGDLTLRAWQALAGADVIAAEDTRATRSLLDAWGIGTPMMSAHRHNEASAALAIVERLRNGERVALVSDAGTPAVSDPGGRIVQAVRQAGLPVIPLPGPSAVITALMAAGVTSDANPGFAFAGFAPTKTAARQRWLRNWLRTPGAVVYYEAPHRIRESLADLLAVAGGARQVSLARELTKRFEEVATMPVADAAAWLEADAHRLQGEFVVLVHPLEAAAQPEQEDDAGLDAWLGALLDQVSVRDAARIAARATGQPRDSIYARALALKAAKD